MKIPTPGHGGGWDKTFVAFLGWAFIFVVGILLLGITIPIIVPVAIFALGCYAYSLFIDKD